MMQISMPRGDRRGVEFTVDGAEGITFTEIYVTAKKRFGDRDALWQKRLTEGGVTATGDGYAFVIEPEDTDKLAFGEYVFDIELVADGVKETHTGALELTEEATHAGNEE